MDETLTNTTAVSQNWPGSNGNKRYFTVPQSGELAIRLITCSVGWGCRIHRLHLWRGVRSTRSECPGYDTKLSDGWAPVMQEFWGMQSTPSLPFLPGRLWPGVVASDSALSMSQIELNCVLILNWITWNRSVLTRRQCTWHLTVCKHKLYLY